MVIVILHGYEDDGYTAPLWSEEIFISEDDIIEASKRVVTELFSKLKKEALDLHKDAQYAVIHQIAKL